MQTFMRKYGVADSILFPLYGVTGSDLYTSATFEVGDIKLVLDTGIEILPTNLPTFIGSGYELELTQSELSNKKIMVVIADQTIIKVWLDTTVLIETYGHELAEHPTWAGGTYNGGYSGGYDDYPAMVSADYNQYPDMPDLVFFNENHSGYDQEKNLYDLIITEAFNKHGVKCEYYVVNQNLEHDKIYGEDLNRMLERKFTVMAYFELPEENEYWSRFGIEGIDTFSMFLAKRHFTAASKYDSVGNANSYPEYIPKVGDVIKANYSGLYYEIVTIKYQKQQFLKVSHSWEFIVKPIKDEKVGISSNLQNDEIADFMNISDIFDTSATATQFLSDKLYSPSQTEEPPKESDSFWN